METDRRYFFEGLFIIGFAVAAALCAIWLQKSGNRDDVLYRIHFSQSVSGLSVGDLVKYHGVDVGSVKTIALDSTDPRQVEVDVSLRKDAPVKTDTKATLTLKGITGVVYIELSGGDPEAPELPTTSQDGGIPEIPSERSSLGAIVDKLPKLIDKFSSLGDQAKGVLANVNEATTQIKEHPSQLFWGAKDKPAEKKPSRK